MTPEDKRYAYDVWKLWENEVFDILDSLNSKVFLGISKIDYGLPYYAYLFPRLTHAFTEHVVHLTQQSPLRYLKMEYHLLLDAPTYNIVMGILANNPAKLYVGFFDVEHIAGFGIPFQERGDFPEVLYTNTHGLNENLMDDFNAIARTARLRMKSRLTIYK